MLLIVVSVCLLALTCGFIVAATILGAHHITRLVDSAVDRQNQVMVNTLEGITGMLKDAVISTVASTTQGVMVSLVGDDKKPVEQRTVPPEGDLNDPAWTMWNDGDENSELADIGDSVFFQRPEADMMRVAGIEEGEAIIPGVPVPDMSGESWREG